MKLSTMNEILADLVERKLTHTQIATKHHLHVSTIGRMVKKNGLYRGQGVKHYWLFKKWTPELAYVVGAFITDGTITHSPGKNGKKYISGISMSVTSIEFSDRFENSLKAEKLPTSYFVRPPRKLNELPQKVVSCYCSMFGKWIKEQTKNKAAVPDILDQSIEIQRSFIEGIIDGDGFITIEGSIRVRTIDEWVTCLPNLLYKMGIRYKVNEEKTPRGAPYNSVTINRKDFRVLQPSLAVTIKMDRLLNAKSRRIRKNRINKKYPCRQCEKPSSRKGRLCVECYRTSTELIERLRSQASKANIAANKVRRGKK